MRISQRRLHLGAMRGYCLRAPGAGTRDDVERDWAQQLRTARNTKLRANHGTSPAEEKLRDELEDGQTWDLYGFMAVFCSYLFL
jgi:hypothetical protein